MSENHETYWKSACMTVNVIVFWSVVQNLKTLCEFPGVPGGNCTMTTWYEHCRMQVTFGVDQKCFFFYPNFS
jgi:hypothetical protein